MESGKSRGRNQGGSQDKRRLGHTQNNRKVLETFTTKWGSQTKEKETRQMIISEVSQK